MAAIDSWIQSIKLILLYGWPFIILIWLIFLKFRYKGWPIEAIIFEKKDNNLIKTNDRAGRYVDGFTGMTGYKLQKAGDTIPVYDFDWIIHNVFRPTTLSERIVALLRGNAGTIFLYRYGSKQYKPIKVNVNGKVKIEYKEILDEKGQSKSIKIYQPLDPRDKLGALNFEVVDWDNMNFMVQEQRASIERRKKRGDWIKTVALPIAILAVTSVLCIIMIKYGYDYGVNLSKTSINTQPQQDIQATKPNIPIIGDVLPQ